MLATIHHECMTSRGSEMDILLDVPMPFFPPIGYSMKFTKRGEFLKIDEVQWDLTDPGKIHIYVSDEESLLPWKKMQAEGWRGA